MSHMVKCAICGIQFDRDRIQAVKHGARRYSHFECEPSGEKVPLAASADPDLVALEEYTKKLLGEAYVPARVKKQIKNYKEEYNYTYSGMLKSLIYFYEVKGNSTDKACGGIGIVPYIYQDAFNYYKALFIAKQTNETKIGNIAYKTKEVTIKLPTIEKKKAKFDFSDLEGDDEE